MRIAQILLIAVALLSACGSRQTVRAKIFERKQIEAGRLMIKYTYLVNDKNFTDSSVIKNTVVSTDSIDVIIDPANPANGIPDLKQSQQH